MADNWSKDPALETNQMEVEDPSTQVSFITTTLCKGIDSVAIGYPPYSSIYSPILLAYPQMAFVRQ